MRVAFVADVHVGNPAVFGGPYRSGVNARGRLVLDTLDRAVARCQALHVDRLVVAGDLFDSDVPPPQLVAEVASIFADRVGVTVVVGNHDQRSADPGDHAVTALGALGSVTVVDRPLCLALDHGAYLLAVPFHRDDARVYIPAAVRRLRASLPAEACGVVCAHTGLADAATPAFLRDAHDTMPAAAMLALLGEDPRTVAAVVGNWHRAGTWTRAREGAPELRAEQVGALAPTGFNNPGVGAHYGGFVVFDTYDGTWTREVIPGPRFELLAPPFAAAAEALRAAASDPYAAPLYVSWRLGLEEDRDAAERLLRASPTVAGYRLLRDARALARQTAVAADRARAAGSIPAALAAYTGAMVLPPGVAAEEVRAECEGWLAGS